ncbi:hypothetical protein ATM17_13150 [Sphingopyxis macrogoltabida]|uniref:Uncharacterized protein n=1 Tax=Sphingopyxis macrogoltabida TaxID=33050 RepID=A0AAC8Z1B8_SPHMC|nr:hypothetical protein LH19_06650 [Sphingopyxis macrogoltabida]AMU89984.1 hypothetical protein ATM17_13150 [Sphingopyxis macrogoltabida]
MAQCLSLEQVRFIAATVAPYFGPLIDHAADGPPIEEPRDIIVRAAAAIERNNSLMEMIVLEAGGQSEGNSWATKFRALGICQATLASHTAELVAEVVIDELSRHASSLCDPDGKLP